MFYLLIVKFTNLFTGCKISVEGSKKNITVIVIVISIINIGLQSGTLTFSFLMACRYPPVHGHHPYCPTSSVYDESHATRVGLRCPYKHHSYFWKAVDESRFLILGNSLAKKIRQLTYTDVQAFPGVNLERLLQKIDINRFAQVENYEVIVVAMGTNNIDDCSVDQIIQDLTSVVQSIFNHN